MAVSLGLTISQNSRNATDNTSNVTVVLTVYWTAGSYNGNSPSGTLTIDGADYPFTCNFNYAGIGQGNVSQSGSTTAISKTLDIAHDADGTKTLHCSARFASGTASGTVTASGSKVLTANPSGSYGDNTGGDSGGDGEEEITLWNYRFLYEVSGDTAVVFTHKRNVVDFKNGHTGSGEKKISFSNPVWYVFVKTPDADEHELVFSVTDRNGVEQPITTDQYGTYATVSGYTEETSINDSIFYVVARINKGDQEHVDTGGASIDTGSSNATYSCYIENGSDWSQYKVYIDNGSSWDLYT